LIILKKADVLPLFFNTAINNFNLIKNIFMDFLLIKEYSYIIKFYELALRKKK